MGMLDALDAQPGERVLEIGTGIGWNAALLASVVGAENVVTVEIDQRLAERARKSLASAGYGAVQVLTADGVTPNVEGKFDRVIATVGISTVSYAWVTVLVEGGRLAPLTNPYKPPGIVALTRHDDTAAGSLAGPADFMALRSERVTRRSVVEFSAVGPHTQGTTEVPVPPGGDRHAAVAIGQRVQGVHRAWRPAGEDGGCLWLYAPAERSIGTIDIDDGLPYEVEQTGHRHWSMRCRPPTHGGWTSARGRSTGSPDPCTSPRPKVGLIGVGFSPAVSGAGDLLDSLLVRENFILAGVPTGVIASLLTHGIAVPHMAATGDEYLIEKFVRPTLAGELIGSYAVATRCLALTLGWVRRHETFGRPLAGRPQADRASM
ncbi:MAG: methyltransferase domain-containing protein [Pseudonocardiales bacterium]|nr:methyltransferase domain-containing protein [Pseudonocardiales bacterium]